MFEKLKADIAVFDKSHGKGIVAKLYYPMFLAVILIRLQSYLFNIKILRPISYLIVRVNDLFHGIWLGPQVQIGKGLFLAHARGLVVNPETIIGENCTILQRVTIGGPNIIIGDNVFIGAGAQIISRRHKKGGLKIGDNVKIAAGSVVIHDIPDNVTVAGIPATIVRK